MGHEQIQNLVDFIRQHNINVMRSLYTWGEDENPVNMKDSIRIVTNKMGFGVRQGLCPELLSSEVKAINWALDNGYIEDEWSEELVMRKELDVFANKNSKHISPQQIAEALNVSEEDIYSRIDTLEGLRMVWVGGVIRTLAIEAYREAFSKGLIIRNNNNE